MISDKLLIELDPFIISFIWNCNRKLRPIFKTVFSCDGHMKEPAYVIVNPSAKSVFEEYKAAVEEYDFIVERVLLSGRERYKIIISYTKRHELLEKLDTLLHIGETICQTRKSLMRRYRSNQRIKD